MLVALDTSPRAPVVFAAAHRLAELTGASLIVYRAVAVPPDMPREVLAATDRRLEDLLIANARTDLTRLTAEIRSARIEHQLVEFATPWDGICRMARTHAVDLIVIGSHGYSKLERLLGTTAAKVVNHTDRNILVVRASLDRDERS